MSDQESALLRVAAAFDRRHTPYMVIGGLANVVWGEPRATLDVDVTVWVDEPELAGVVADLCAAFRSMVEDLILMKIISNREQDLADAAGVAARRMAVLDLGYLEPRVRELAELLVRPEIWGRWSAWKERTAHRP